MPDAVMLRGGAPATSPPPRRWRGVAGAPPRILGTLAVAIGLAGLWLAAPPLGTDLSAQVARAEFFADYGWAPIDFRWYGGVAPHGYSLVSPPLMAWFGPRPVGAAAAVVSAVALAALLHRTGARRPLLGGVLGAVCFVGNLVSGRVTFALGVALGLLALLVLAGPPSEGRRDAGAVRSPGAVRSAGAAVRWAAVRWAAVRWAAVRSARTVRYAGAGGLAALAAATSPVAGLFVGLAGTAVVLGSRVPTPSFGVRGRPEAPDRPPSGYEGGSGARGSGVRGSGAHGPGARGSGAVGGVVLAVGAAVPIAVMAGLFGSGGWMNMSRSDMLHATVTSLAVAVLVPHRVVRVGALLSAAGVVTAYLATTPVGLNATRLATLFALPLVAAYVTVPDRMRRALPRRLAGLLRPVVWLVPVLLVLAWWQPPVLDEDLASAGDPTASRDYFAPLAGELARRAPAGRVEVVPTVNYWESAYLDTAPLARGWLRQADLGRNPLFFDGTLDAASYRRWLLDTGVSHVAIADADVSWVGRREAALVRQGLPYLTPVWEHPDWTLYEVAGAPSIVDGPAELARSTPAAVVFRATAPGEILVRVRWSRWLAVTGPGQACLAPAGEWTVARVAGPGEYRVTGSLAAPGPGC